jgi:hypothetical protein
MKEPKEKALELIEKFVEPARKYKLKRPLFSERRQALEAAIICVDQVIEVIPMYTGNLNPKWKYWNEVKNHLNQNK